MIPYSQKYLDVQKPLRVGMSFVISVGHNSDIDDGLAMQNRVAGFAHLKKSGIRPKQVKYSVTSAAAVI